MEKERQTVYVVLEGELITRNAGSLKNKLMLALAGSQNLVIELKQVMKMDLSVIQLFIALQKSAAGLGKKVSYCFEHSVDIIPLIERSGFREILNDKSMSLT